ncbi:MAG: hypothetical protein COA74_05090 [Gammaproteobacteria bacterium]|nr:MAG: hypothetical protein COA74_05090 [Gammaproteobacteria bacterium]
MSTRLTPKNRQQGVTFVGWLLILGLVGFFVLLSLRLFPIYSNHYKIKSVLTSLTEERNLFRMTKKDMLRIIDRKLNINFAKGFKPEHLIFVMAKSGNREIHITYEDRRAILGNLDVVAQFSDYIVVTPNGKAKIGL